MAERLITRSTLSFAALPGVVAYVVPLLLLRPAGQAPTFTCASCSGRGPWVADTFGDEWTRYKRAVPRWLGRRRPSAGDAERGV